MNERFKIIIQVYLGQKENFEYRNFSNRFLGVQLAGTLCPDHTCLSVAPGRVSQYTSDNSETGEMNIKNISQYQVNPIMSMSVLA